MLFTCAAFTGCRSVTATKSAARPAPALAAYPAPGQNHAQIISVYGDGETQFLGMLPEGATLN